PDGLSRRPDHSTDGGDNTARTVLPESRLHRRAAVVRMENLGESEVKARAAHLLESDAEILVRVREATPRDPRLEVVFAKEKGPAVLQARLKGWEVVNGVVYYRGLVYVPNDDGIKRRILE
ncbi:hypothetical protein CYLTODRAFT_332274, partial [Cylindrobasidium torrendii FP15055 ss-10]